MDGVGAPGAGPVEAAAPAQTPRRAVPVVVLVVEDEPLIAMTTIDMIEGMGHEALEAGDGARALALLAARPDVAVMVSDFGLPDMDGAALCARARELRPDLPVVFATGHAPPGLARSGVTPATLVMVKPYSGEDLRQALGAALADRPA